MNDYLYIDLTKHFTFYWSNCLLSGSPSSRVLIFLLSWKHDEFMDLERVLCSRSEGHKAEGRVAEICSREDCKGRSVLDHYLTETYRTLPKNFKHREWYSIPIVIYPIERRWSQKFAAPITFPCSTKVLNASSQPSESRSDCFKISRSLRAQIAQLM